MLRRYEAMLARLRERGRFRQLSPARGHDFTSNDYLGLANSGELRAAVREALDSGVAAGSGGSRLLRGNCLEHERLEEEAAPF
ncbi:MAG TPA: 8-amino-7-oxononanoate synthase, partial [Hyphomicrobiales bacterium]|nr:8-amino-7-oxononanoate synthase [Hyphomicrobiales bacterium]